MVKSASGISVIIHNVAFMAGPLMCDSILTCSKHKQASPSMRAHLDVHVAVGKYLPSTPLPLCPRVPRCTYKHPYTHVCSQSTCTVHLHISSNKTACIYIQISVHMCTHIYVDAFSIYIQERMSTHFCRYIYICTQTYTHVYAYESKLLLYRIVDS